MAALNGGRAFKAADLLAEVKRLKKVKDKINIYPAKMSKLQLAEVIVFLRTCDDASTAVAPRLTGPQILETFAGNVEACLRNEHEEGTRNQYWRLYQHFVAFAKSCGLDYVLTLQTPGGPAVEHLNYRAIRPAFVTTYMESLVTPPSQRTPEERAAYDAAENGKKSIVRPSMSTFSHIIAAIE